MIATVRPRWRMLGNCLREASSSPAKTVKQTSYIKKIMVSKLISFLLLKPQS